MKRIVNVFALIVILVFIGGFSASLVLGEAGNGSQNATVTVTATPTFVPLPPPGGGAGGGVLPMSILIMDTLGGVTRVPIESNGILPKSLIVANPSGNVILGFDIGTKIICGDGRVPARLEVKLCEEPPPVPDGFVAVSPVYDFITCVFGGVPGSVTFDPPVTLQIRYETEGLSDDTLSVFVAYYDEENGWTRLEPPTGFVGDVGIAGANVSHLTPFVVMAELASPPLPASFEVRNLDINPIQVTAGESVTISAQLVNIGGLVGEHNLIVNVEALLETSRLIILNPGQSEVITFTVTPSNPGSYQVTIGDARGNFEAEAIPAAPAVGVTVPGWLIAIISAGAVIVVLAIIAAKKKLQRAGVAEEPLKAVTGAFCVSNLKIVPRQVKPDVGVTIIAEAVNTGSVTSNYSLVLKIKGMVEAVKEIALSPGQSQKVAFAIFKDKPGVYDVDLEGLKGTFTVEEVIAPPDSPYERDR